jgi:hypothetical protein
MSHSVYQIGDVILTDENKIYEITQLPGYSNIHKNFFEGIDQDSGERVLFTVNHIVKMIKSANRNS